MPGANVNVDCRFLDIIYNIKEYGVSGAPQGHWCLEALRLVSVWQSKDNVSK